LLLAHQNLSTVSILGIVVANGMAVSNAILLLDLILRKRAEGLSRSEAILEAGPIRLRPILMTTIVSRARAGRSFSKDGHRRVLAACNGHHRWAHRLDRFDALRRTGALRVVRRVIVTIEVTASH